MCVKCSVREAANASDWDEVARLAREAKKAEKAEAAPAEEEKPKAASKSSGKD